MQNNYSTCIIYFFYHRNTALHIEELNLHSLSPGGHVSLSENKDENSNVESVLFSFLTRLWPEFVCSGSCKNY